MPLRAHGDLIDRSRPQSVGARSAADHHGKLLGSVQPLGAKRLVQAWFTGPGRVLIAYTTGELFEWDTRGDAWEDHACAVARRNLTTSEWAGLLSDRDYRVTCPQYPPGA